MQVQPGGVGGDQVHRERRDHAGGKPVERHPRDDLAARCGDPGVGLERLDRPHFGVGDRVGGQVDEERQEASDQRGLTGQLDHLVVAAELGGGHDADVAAHVTHGGRGR